MRRIHLILLLTLALGGCAGGPRPQPPAAGTDDSAAYQALQQGDYRTAASEFSRLAETAPSPQRLDYQLNAAEAMLKAGMAPQARAYADRITVSADASPRQKMRLQLLRAELALSEQNPDQALELLQQLQGPHDATALYARLHALRAKAYARLGNHLEAAREHVLEESFLKDPAAIRANQNAIWQSLSTLTDPFLAQMRTSPPDVFSGWIDLVRIAKNLKLSPQAMNQAIAGWQQNYPDHPALPSFLDALRERSQELALRPSKIALLLPLTGRFAEAASALRDGVMAAYYASTDHNSVTLRIYDVGGNPNRVTTAYDQAVQDGAQFIIGPLSKEAVDVLMQRESFPVPTLTLNYSDNSASSARENLYQFALSPEDEARQVAERGWLDGYGRAAVLAPNGDWGSRVANAFATRWQQLGGSVVSAQRYDQSHSDFSTPIKRLLNIDQSEARDQDLEYTIGQDLEFTPRRRQDIDFIFLAAFPRQARLIRPQLKFHHAGDIPIYAPSSVFSGTADANQDRDMDSITFDGMPWNLGAPSPNQALRAQTAKLFKDYSGSLRSLLAMGVDAFDVIPVLKVLQSYPHERFQGETGTLRVDANHHLQRQLLWAQFKGGVPKLQATPDDITTVQSP